MNKEKNIGKLFYNQKECSIKLMIPGDKTSYLIETEGKVKVVSRDEVSGVNFSREGVLSQALDEMVELVNKLPWTPLIFLEKSLERSIDEEPSAFRRKQAEEALEMAKNGLDCDDELLDKKIIKRAVKIMESVINLLGNK